MRGEPSFEPSFEPRLPRLSAALVCAAAALTLLWPLLTGHILFGGDRDVSVRQVLVTSGVFAQYLHRSRSSAHSTPNSRHLHLSNEAQTADPTHLCLIST